MNKEPLISIVTVCLNSAEYIERCIKSVLSQTYTNVEYIIIDGGSTDGTQEIIKKYENRITCWISENDRGIYDAMNKGIAMCKGEFIGLLNSDDYYPADTIQTVVKAISDDESIDILHGNALVMFPNGNILSKGNHDDLLRNWSVIHPTCFIKSEIYNSYKYDQNIKISADYDLLLKLWRDGKHFRYIDHFLTYFSPFGVSSRPSWSAVIERFDIRAKYNLGVAIVNFFRDVFLYCDELIYSASVKNGLKLNTSCRVFSYTKAVFRPFLLFAKKLILNRR